MSVGRICSRVVVTVARRETVRAAAQRMAEHGVGTLVVTDNHGIVEPCGVITDRDITLRCVAADLDPDQTPVSQLMTTPVDTVPDHMPIEEAVDRMAATVTRRLVVTGDRHELVGILSLDDVLEVLAEEVESIGRLIERQQHGSVDARAAGATSRKV